METIVTASTEKLGNLCFQLMMTGYMFRNVEYLLALKSLMNLEASATLQDFREAFDRIDTDGNGFLDRQEIEALLADVYDGEPPTFEVETFLEFFDQNNDGQIRYVVCGVVHRHVYFHSTHVNVAGRNSKRASEISKRQGAMTMGRMELVFSLLQCWKKKTKTFKSPNLRYRAQ